MIKKNFIIVIILLLAINGFAQISDEKHIAQQSPCGYDIEYDVEVKYSLYLGEPVEDIYIKNIKRFSNNIYYNNVIINDASINTEDLPGFLPEKITVQWQVNNTKYTRIINTKYGNGKAHTGGVTSYSSVFPGISAEKAKALFKSGFSVSITQGANKVYWNCNEFKQFSEAYWNNINGNDLCRLGKYKEAIELYKKVPWSVSGEYKKAQNNIIRCKEKVKQQEYQQKINQVNNEYQSKNFESAKSIYEEALSLKPNDTYAQNKINEINDILKQREDAIKQEVQKDINKQNEAKIKEQEIIDNAKRRSEEQKQKDLAAKKRTEEVYRKYKEINDAWSFGHDISDLSDISIDDIDLFQCKHVLGAYFAFGYGENNPIGNWSKPINNDFFDREYLKNNAPMASESGNVIFIQTSLPFSYNYDYSRVFLNAIFDFQYKTAHMNWENLQYHKTENSYYNKYSNSSLDDFEYSSTDFSGGLSLQYIPLKFMEIHAYYMIGVNNLGTIFNMSPFPSISSTHTWAYDKQAYDDGKYSEITFHRKFKPDWPNISHKVGIGIRFPCVMFSINWFFSEYKYTYFDSYNGNTPIEYEGMTKTNFLTFSIYLALSYKQ